MKRLLIFNYSLFCYFFAVGQFKNDLPGKYDTRNETHNNRHHYEELVLNTDSTFNYFARPTEFVQLKINGRWSVKDDTLILNEDHPTYRQNIIVKENVNKKVQKGCASIILTYYDGLQLNFQVGATHGDTTVLLKNQYGSSLVKLFPIDDFYINGPLFRYPSYKVLNKKSNEFKVQVAPQKLFINEKWLIVNGSLRPRGFDNEYANYYLKKKE